MKKILSILLLAVLTNAAFANTFILTANSGTAIRLTPAVLATSFSSYVPGDTFLIKSSVSSLYIEGLFGASSKHVVVTTLPGVVIGGATNRSVELYNCRYVHLYNFNIQGANQTIMGVKATKISNLKLENIQVASASVGISIKNDPDSLDALTHAPTTVDSIYLKNCDVKNTNNEGYYIGYTSCTGYSGRGINVPVSRINGVFIDSISATNTGWDGIQITNAQNCKAKGMYTYNTGVSNTSSQRSCIALQNGVTGSFEKIDCRVSTGGIAIFGCGDFVVNDVYLENITNSGAGASAIFADNRSDCGYGLSPRRLLMDNIVIVNTSNPNAGRPIYILNSQQYGTTSVPGIISNLKYAPIQWTNRISDAVPNVYTSISTLPIILSSFDAIKMQQSVKVKWETASEENAAYFELQHSTDGQHYTAIGKVNATGNSTQTKKYSLTDLHPTEGINYYRLATVDNDGTIVYSKIASEVFSTDDKTSGDFRLINASPVPVKDYVNIKYNASGTMNVTIQLISIQGSIITKQPALMQQGEGSITLHGLQSLAAGVYVLRIVNEKGYSQVMKIQK